MFLDAIVADVDERIRRLVSVAPYLRDQALGMGPTRSLISTLSGDNLAVIAECKQKSPSKGWLTNSYDPVGQAQRYERDGARAVSVLTEPKFFAGELAHLEAVRAVLGVPVLRKDFVRDPVQLFEARAHGADAALLIVRIVDDAQLLDLYQTASAIGLEVLVEVHAQSEVERALAVDPKIVGVNNRDLDSFETHLEFSRDMAEMLPPGIIRVSESGISSRSDLQMIQGWGYDAVLIGETLIRGANLLLEWTHDQR